MQLQRTVLLLEKRCLHVFYQVKIKNSKIEVLKRDLCSQQVQIAHQKLWQI